IRSAGISADASPAVDGTHMRIVAGTLSRYFGLRFVGAVAIVFLGLFVLVALLDYMELMRRAGDIPHVSTLLVAKTSFYRVPQVIERILPFCVLIADGELPQFVAAARIGDRARRRHVGLAIHFTGA